MHATIHKSVPFELLELKGSGDAWTFSGYASTFGNVDLGGDVVMPGAFADSLKLRPKPKLLWSHDRDEPIGIVQSLTEDEKGLRGEWKLIDTARGQDAYKLLKAGAVDSMSIGYIPADSEFTDDGIRKLKSIDLLEVSLVTIPMNEEAQITAVKASGLPLQAHLERVLGEVRQLIERCTAESKAAGGIPADLPDSLKALAAEIERIPREDSASDAGRKQPVGSLSGDDLSALSVTQLRLRILHKRLRTADELKDVWTTAYVNDLPDSAFAAVYTDAGGTKQRKLPHHAQGGSLDTPHLRAALSRESQTDMPQSAHARAQAHLGRHAKAEGIGST